MTNPSKLEQVARAMFADKADKRNQPTTWGLFQPRPRKWEPATPRDAVRAALKEEK